LHFGWLILLLGCGFIFLEGVSLVSILAINEGHIFSDWPSALVIEDCRQQLSHFSV
jgi:hypothetical protein